MTTFEEISRNIPGIRVDYLRLYNWFLKERYPEDIIIASISQDLGIPKDIITRNLDDLSIIVNKNGMFADYTEYIKQTLKKYNIEEIPDIYTLKNMYQKATQLKSYKKARNILPQPVFYKFKNYERETKAEYIDFAKAKKNRIKEEYEKTPSTTKEEQKRKIKLRNIYNNFNIEAEAKMMCFKDFLEDYIDDIKKCIQLLSVTRTKKLSRVISLCNLEKIYYYAAQIIVKNQTNLAKDKKLEYLTNYLRHIKPFTKEDLTLNNIALGLSYQDKTKYSIKEIIDYVEAKSSYRFKQEKKEEEKPTIRNLEIYDYEFFVNENPTLVRQTLEHYYQLGKASKDRDLKELLCRKAAYYAKLDPTAIKQGINRYDGYIGFVIDGKVVLEHFFEDIKRRKIATDEAVYIIDEKDFDEVTRLGKLDVIEKINNKELDATRIYHTGDWEDRINKVLKLKRD